MVLVISSLLRVGCICRLLQIRPVSVESVPVSNSKDEHVFGVDVSFPMHYPIVRTATTRMPDDNDTHTSGGNAVVKYPFADTKQKLYDDWLQGCRNHFPADETVGVSACDQCEHDRIEMNLLQPRTMRNYTSAGYAKIRTPAEVYNRLKKYFDKNAPNQFEPEVWPVGNTYTNQWESLTHILDSEHGDAYDPDLYSEVIDATQKILEAWTGQNLVFASIYGIRVYMGGSILAPHVDRLPLVSSAIINIAQSVDKPWPLEVIGHDQLAHNLTMDPGDMILYESHSVIHGRPYPLEGNFYASIFVHFEPHGYTKRYAES